MNRLIYILAAVAIIFQSQSAVICWPLLPVAVMLGQAQNERKLYFFAFIAGILADLVSGRILGLSAIFLISFILIAQILKTRFKFNLRLALCLLFVFEIIYFVLIRIFGF